MLFSQLSGSLRDMAILSVIRQRDSKGRMSSTIFEIFEEPQPVSPDTEKPHMENPDVDNPDMGKPHGEIRHK
jgi:hypothetical protein